LCVVVASARFDAEGADVEDVAVVT